MPDYFETMGIPIVRGRGFQPADATSSGLVAIVNEKFAERFWKGRDPIGQRVKPCCNDQPPWFTVVGVAKDVKQGGVDQETGTELYMSVRADREARSGVGDCATQPRGVAHVPSHQRHCRRPLSGSSVKWTPRCRSFAFGIWRRSLPNPSSGLASWRSSLGSLRAWRCCSPPSARTGSSPRSLRSGAREIGIRMALGADRSSVLADVMREGLLLAGIGVVVGLAGAFGLNRLIASLLFGVRPTDVPTAGRRGRHDDRRGSGGMFAAGLAGVATRSERGAESIERQTT